MGDIRMFRVELKTQEVAEICRKFHNKKINMLLDNKAKLVKWLENTQFCLSKKEVKTLLVDTVFMKYR